MKYIATREGVEITESNAPATEKQKALIADVLHDFPDSKELFEYEDYLAKPTSGMASAFLSAALDRNAHTIQDGDVYMKYIATRPRAEKYGEHGLFSSFFHVDLDAAMRELEAHRGNTWTFIYSLRREEPVLETVAGVVPDLLHLPEGCSGVISFVIKGGRETAMKFMDSLQLASNEVHVADIRSCILHPASTTHRQLTDEQLEAAGIGQGLVRLSVGLENIDDIIEDIKQAFEKID